MYTVNQELHTGRVNAPRRLTTKFSSIKLGLGEENFMGAQRSYN